MVIKILDLTRNFFKIRPEIDLQIKKIFDSQDFILGASVFNFEAHCNNYLNVKNSISCASGSDALLLAGMSLNLKHDDEIITSPFTFFATAGSISRLGAKPVFVDVDPDTFNINLNQVREKINISDKIKAFIPIHLFGQMTPLENITDELKEKNIKIIEDAAQAFGTHRNINGEIIKAGTIGDIGCYSFFPTKNLGACGDAGMCVTNNDELAKRLFKLRVHGSGKTYYHDEIGINSRLDAIQAVILDIKLKYLDEWNAERRKLAENYKNLFALHGLDEFITIPYELPGNYHIYHQYVIKVHNNKRDDLMKFLENLGVQTRIYYPLPLHLQPCFKYLGYKAGDFPVAEKLSNEVLALPVYPGLELNEQEYLIESMEKFFKS